MKMIPFLIMFFPISIIYGSYHIFDFAILQILNPIGSEIVWVSFLVSMFHIVWALMLLYYVIMSCTVSINGLEHFRDKKHFLLSLSIPLYYWIDHLTHKSSGGVTKFKSWYDKCGYDFDELGIAEEDLPVHRLKRERRERMRQIGV